MSSETREMEQADAEAHSLYETQASSANPLARTKGCATSQPKTHEKPNQKNHTELAVSTTTATTKQKQTKEGGGWGRREEYSLSLFSLRNRNTTGYTQWSANESIGSGVWNFSLNFLLLSLFPPPLLFLLYSAEVGRFLCGSVAFPPSGLITPFFVSQRKPLFSF
ncbi:hypothetical protein J3F83DRAFT_740634 [Trichoderma novae-zelandiae]